MPEKLVMIIRHAEKPIPGARGRHPMAKQSWQA